MLTEYGKELRKIRIDHDEVLKDMANRLKVSSSFLSAVEAGKKNAPENWSKLIANEYNLGADGEKRLRKLAKEAVTAVKLTLEGLSLEKRQAALVFARDFTSMPDDTAKKILNLMNRQKKGCD